MTIVHLLESVKEVVEEALVNASFEVDGDVETEPAKRVSVYLGYLPFKTVPENVPLGMTPISEIENPEPFVLIRATTGEDEDFEVDTAKVKILVGSKSFKVVGYMDVLHIFELIRFAIARKHWIGGKYEAIGKVKWTLAEEQPWPEWNGIIETTWTLPGVEKEDLFDVHN